MKLLVIIERAFPNGDAGTFRILSYTKELVKIGVDVEVHCVMPTEIEGQTSLNTEAVGEYQGIKFQYTSGTQIWPKSGTKIIRKIKLKFDGYWNSVKYIYKYRNQIDFILLYSPLLKTYYTYFFICKLLGINLLLERSELPMIEKFSGDYSKNILKRIYKSIYKKSFKLFKGWILETQNLVDYYLPLSNKDAKCCIVPMTVDIDRFSNVETLPNEYGDYIAYCGNMCEIDGISILIKAFAIVQKKYDNIKLVLAGDSVDVPAQKKLVEELDIKDKVVFLGRVSGDVVPSLLANAKVLALASPTSKRSVATMPCKVGEYLCTSVPVVVTGLGEINKYLRDGVSAFLAKPDSEEFFAEKLVEVLSDYDKAKSIGMEGKKVALKHFNSTVQAERIKEYLQSML